MVSSVFGEGPRVSLGWDGTCRELELITDLQPLSHREMVNTGADHRGLSTVSGAPKEAGGGRKVSGSLSAVEATIHLQPTKEGKKTRPKARTLGLHQPPPTPQPPTLPHSSRHKHDTTCVVVIKGIY